MWFSFLFSKYCFHMPCGQTTVSPELWIAYRSKISQTLITNFLSKHGIGFIFTCFFSHWFDKKKEHSTIFKNSFIISKFSWYCRYCGLCIYLLPQLSSIKLILLSRTATNRKWWSNMAQAISEFTKGPTNGLNSVSIFIQDNFERAAAENFTTQVTLWYFVLKIVRTYWEKNCFVNKQKRPFLKISPFRTIYSISESSELFFETEYFFNLFLDFSQI